MYIESREQKFCEQNQKKVVQNQRIEMDTDNNEQQILIKQT